MTENKKTNYFASAFIAAQKEMGNASKDSKNPFFKSTYADLNAVREACLPVLNKHGIAAPQTVIQKDGKNYVRTMLIHESGETSESIGILPCDVEIIFSKNNDAQSQGSGITYARRYGLQTMANIGAEDDDGNNASAKKGEIKKNASGLSPDGELANGNDMKETQRNMNKDTAEKIKQALRDCETLGEIADVKVKSEKEIKRLQKYAADIFEEVVEVAISMKKEIEEADGNFDDSDKLAQI